MAARVPPGAVKHQWMRTRLRREIEHLPPHSALPTERELAQKFGLSRATVRKALGDLDELGLVYRVQGAGTFVASRAVSKSLTLTSFSEDMRDRGFRPGSRIIVADEVPASAQTAGELDVTPGTALIRLVRLRLADDQPMCIETAYLRAADVPRLLADLPDSLYEYLAACGRVPVRAEQTVRAATLEGAEAGLLGLAPGSAALQVRRVGFDARERATEITTSIYRADLYELTFTIRREAL